MKTEQGKLTLEKFLASVIRNQRKKTGGYPVDFLYLTSKEVTLYNNLFRQRLIQLEDSGWKDENFILIKGHQASFVHIKWGFKITWAQVMFDKGILTKFTKKGKKILSLIYPVVVVCL